MGSNNQISFKQAKVQNKKLKYIKNSLMGIKEKNVNDWSISMKYWLINVM